MLLTPVDTKEPPGAPRPGVVGVVCATGLLAGREGVIDIWFCWRKDTRKKENITYTVYKLATKIESSLQL